VLEELGLDTLDVQRMAATYAAFVNYAFDPVSQRFRNFMSYDRRWLEQEGSEDSLGRAAWALGTCVGRSKRRSLQSWGIQLFEKILPAVAETTSPRAWAFTLIGIHEYFRRLSGDRLVDQLRDTLATRLAELYENSAAPDWLWFEPKATYDNAKLSHALILSGRWGNAPQVLQIGLRSLRWLADQQLAPAGHFRPIGCNGFYPQGEEAALYDQQPLETHAMVSACIEAFRATQDHAWLDQARLSFEWFLGRNDLGMPLCDTVTGGCRDGLLADRINENQGAESTLAFLLALAEMQLVEDSLATIRKASDIDLAADSSSNRLSQPT
jgi:hypothetical protein